MMENYNLLNNFENALFNRREIKFSVTAKSTPNHEEIEKFISEKFKLPVENIKLKQIKGEFGSNVFVIKANLYSSMEDKENIENKKKWEIEKVKKLQEAKNSEQLTEDKNKTEEIKSK